MAWRSTTRLKHVNTRGSETIAPEPAVVPPVSPITSRSQSGDARKSPSPTNPEPSGMSDDASSALSDIEDGVGERSDSRSITSPQNGDKAVESDPETEAETERLDESPQKNQSGAAADEPGDEDDPNNQPTTTDAVEDPESAGPDLTPQDLLGGPTLDSEAQILNNGTLLPTTSPGATGKKRKRTASTSRQLNEPLEGEPLKKRNAASRLEDRIVESRKNAMSDRIADAEEDNEEAVSLGPSSDELHDAQETIDESTEQEAYGSATVGKAKRSLSKHEEDAAEEQTNEDNDAEDMGQEQLDPLEGEGHHDEEADDDEADEADAAAKTEDELAKKRVAMDALVPIEKLFAVFRDRLFDERWAQLSAELDVLNTPNTVHPDYLAMRQAIDARRDEKMHLEQVALAYKTKSLENKVLAVRAQLHGQYFQKVREIRERFLEKLNEQFSQIQRERREWKAKEPHFVYNFEPKRSRQIAHQTAYNKEVSLLSGIARHVGFPRAPEITGASSADVEDDFRAMKIKPAAKPVSYTAQIANSARADEAAAEEQFIERTPWANPNHPAHQQALLVDRAPMAQPARPPVVTPAGQRLPLDPNRAVGQSGSTIPLNSDPPSAQPPHSQPDTIPNGSSPYETLKRKDIAASQPINDTTETPHSSNPQPDRYSQKSKGGYSNDPPTAPYTFLSSASNPNRVADLHSGNPGFEGKTFGDQSHSQASSPLLTRELIELDRQNRPPSPSQPPRDERFAQDSVNRNIGVSQQYSVR